MTEAGILIIGAGPSGLFAAGELARHGVPARIIDCEERPHRQARATSIQPGTLEILKSIGLLPAILAASERIDCSRLYGPEMIELGSMSFQGIGCSCEFQCSLPQYETQRILEEHLTRSGGQVERGVRATSMTIDGDALTVDLQHQDGRDETVRPRMVIDAGGAHGIGRQAIGERLTGLTYRGNFIVADIAMGAPLPAHESGVICSRNGLLLLAPLPGGRWICFQDLEEGIEQVTSADLIERIARRLDGRYRPTDVSWVSPFRMHRRIVSRLAHGRCFLIGDAAHLSSPFGGEGLNAGIHDGYNLAWKLALSLQGNATQALLEGYAFERRIADHHVLAVSDEVHLSIVEISEAVRQGKTIQARTADPLKAALSRNARAMIDVDYAASPLVVDYGAGKADATGPRPGQWYPDWPQFSGTAHHVFLFGDLPEADAMGRFERKWSGLLDLSLNPPVDPSRAGLPIGGIVLIRPDGHIGFRIASRDAEAWETLDRHLSSYLVP